METNETRKGKNGFKKLKGKKYKKE